MTYNTKAEFMAALKSQAEKYSLSFGEMAEDFECHFSEGEENGETESEICAKLGDPVEIVKEYAGENSENVQSSNSNVQNITAGVNRVDWALPTLASLVIVYIAVAFAFIVSGAASIISVILPFVSDSVTALLFGRMFNVFAGMVILGLGGIMAPFMPNVIKGFAGVIKAVARLHVRAFAGRKAGF